MSSFLSSSQLTNLTGTFSRLYETMSTGIGNYVDVYREPLKIINNVNSLNIFGYSEDSLNSSDITYSVQSGRFPCIPLYSTNTNSKQFTELKFTLDKNEIAVKVEDSARQYIQQEKVEYLVVNNVKYNLTSSTPYIQNYFGKLYYYFKLEVTQ